ncbi:MAG: NIPSNAP family protein [Rhizobacter sp.]|nr:NIPSNAP family protein [Rhizobacter sp.]
MIFELRTYTLRVGTIKGFLERYEGDWLAVQTRHLGPPVGYFVTEVGELNQGVHLWKYASFDDRDRRRAALDADPQWVAYKTMPANSDALPSQHNTVLRSAPFSPI